MNQLLDSDKSLKTKDVPHKALGANNSNDPSNDLWANHPKNLRFKRFHRIDREKHIWLSEMPKYVSNHDKKRRKESPAK